MVKGKKFSEAEILAILGEIEAGADLSAVATTNGITQRLVSRWQASRNGRLNNCAEELRLLQAENQRLKRIVARQALEIDAYREVTDETW